MRRLLTFAIQLSSEQLLAIFLRAAFTERGFVVDAIIPVGDCLAPSNTPREHRAEFRAVKVYTTDAASTAKR